MGLKCPSPNFLTVSAKSGPASIQWPLTCSPWAPSFTCLTRKYLPGVATTDQQQQQRKQQQQIDSGGHHHQQHVQLQQQQHLDLDGILGIVWKLNESVRALSADVHASLKSFLFGLLYREDIRIMLDAVAAAVLFDINNLASALRRTTTAVARCPWPLPSALHLQNYVGVNEFARYRLSEPISRYTPCPARGDLFVKKNSRAELLTRIRRRGQATQHPHAFDNGAGRGKLRWQQQQKKQQQTLAAQQQPSLRTTDSGCRPLADEYLLETDVFEHARLRSKNCFNGVFRGANSLFEIGKRTMGFKMNILLLNSTGSEQQVAELCTDERLRRHGTVVAVAILAVAETAQQVDTSPGGGETGGPSGSASGGGGDGRRGGGGRRQPLHAVDNGAGWGKLRWQQQQEKQQQTLAAQQQQTSERTEPYYAVGFTF
uniref:Uncharacterized protein n=1 Tax=Globodera rostochiensis TaxID=31243 RepID=A0A914IF08_GLORO